MIWAVLSDKVKYLNLTMVGLTGKNHDIIENDLINSFKFLDLNSKDFLLFLQNKKKGYRFLNSYVGIFFRHKYTANSLFTYNDSKNFDHKIKDFILNSSPLYAQQIAIPVEEFSRLENKFNQNKIKDFIKPKIIILNNDLPFLKKVNLNKDTYCNVFNGAKYILFLSKDENTNCDNFKLILSN